MPNGYIYKLISDNDDKFYIGSCSDIDVGLENHLCCHIFLYKYINNMPRRKSKLSRRRPTTRKRKSKKKCPLTKNFKKNC